MTWPLLILLAASGPVASDRAPRDLPKKTAGIEGSWTVVAMEYSGKRVPSDFFKGNRLVIGRAKIITRKGGRVVAEATYTLFPARKPAAIDMMPTDGPKRGRVVHGIYALDGDSLKICAPGTGGRRPKDFATKAGSDQILMVLRRDKS